MITVIIILVVLDKTVKEFSVGFITVADRPLTFMVFMGRAGQPG